MPDFTINFQVLREESKAAHAAEAAAYKAHVKDADLAAKQVEASSAREAAARTKAVSEVLTAEQAAAKATEELTKRVNAQKVRAIADALDADLKAKEQARRALEVAAEAERARAREAVQAARQVAQARKAALDKQRSEERAARVERARADKEAAAEEVRTNKALAEAKKRAAADEAQAQKDNNSLKDRAVALGGKLVGVLGMVSGAAFGLSSLSGVIDLIADSFKRARDEAQDAGKFAEDYRKTMKEIAFLKGKDAPTAGVVLEDLAYRAKTLQAQGDARGTQEAFRNVAGISIDSADTRAKISQAEAEKGMVYAGQLQAQYGGEAGSFGTLAGVIPATQKTERVTGDDIKRTMLQLVKIGEKGSASQADFAKAMSETTYLTTGGAYRDIKEQGAYASAVSLSTPNQVPANLARLNKMAAGSVNDMTKDPNALMAPGQYLQGMGLSDRNTDPEIFQAMFRDLDARKAESRARGESQFNVGSYLQKMGYNDPENRRSFEQLYSRKDDLNRTLLPLASAKSTTEEADRRFGQFRGSMTGMAQATAVDEDRVKFSIGGGALEYVKSLENRAILAGKSEGKMAGTKEEWVNSYGSQAAMKEILRQEGMARGLDLGVKYTNAGVGGVSADDPLDRYFRGSIGTKERAEGIQALGLRIKEAGGDVLGGNSAIVKRMGENMKLAADALVKSEATLTGIRNNQAPEPVSIAAPGGSNNGRAR